MILLLVALLGATSSRPFAEERELLDRRLETLRRILPDGPFPVFDATLVREMAEGAGLSQPQAVARPPMESGARGTVDVDVVAVGRFTEIDRFFRQVALSPRLIDVESLTLSAGDNDMVRLRTLVHLPYRPARAPLPPPPLGVQAQVQKASREQAEAFLRDQALAVAKSEAIAELRRSRRNPRLFLSELSAVVRDRPVVLTRASLAEEFLVSGLTVGETAMRGLERRFERGFFRIAEVLVVKRGACHRFEVRGRSPVVGPDAEIPLPSEDPFRGEMESCRVDRDPGRATILRAPRAKTSSTGPLALRLRDVDTADVFHVLHRLTSQAFLVDEDVQGRISLDLSGLGMDEVLAALERTGIRISEGGALRRVSRAKVKPLPPPGGDPVGPRISFALKRAEVREILAVMAEADPDLVALGPPGSLGRLSLWTRDMPASDLRAAVLDAAGLSERIDEEEQRVILKGVSETQEAPSPIVGGAEEERLLVAPHELSVEEFELAGLASDGGRWIALAYSPSGALYAYAAGDRLANATITAVESTDVLLETEEGPLRVPLPDPAR